MKRCKVKNCNKSWYATEYCNLHYHRVYRTGKVGDDGRLVGRKTIHPMYPRYRGILQRCYNPKYKYYSYYGGRGISVCERWLGPEGFSNFVNDMGNPPEGMTIDRHDNDGNYEPDNCRWASRTTQQINQRIASTNTSGTRGVHWFKNAGLWTAYIDFRGKRRHLGYFKTKELAIIARLEAELERLHNNN